MVTLRPSGEKPWSKLSSPKTLGICLAKGDHGCRSSNRGGDAMTTTQQTQNHQTSGPWVVRSWISVALIPAFFLVAVMAGYLIYGLFGYTAEQADAPAWVELIVGIVALALFIIPCVGAVFYGWLANKAHDRRGLVPLVIGGIIGLWMTVLSVVTVISAMLD